MKMIRLFFLSMFLAPFVFSMDAQEHANGNKNAIYDYFLNGIIDIPVLRNYLSDTISYSLREWNFAQALDNEMLLEKILGYCNGRIIEHNSEKYPDLDCVIRGINTKSLNFIEKKILIKLMIRKLLYLFSAEERNKLMPLVFPHKAYEKPLSGQVKIHGAKKKRQELLWAKTKDLLDKFNDDHKLKYWLANTASAMIIESGTLEYLLEDKERVEEFLEYYNNLIIKYDLQKQAFLDEDPMGIEIELLSADNKRALMERIIDQIHHLLPRFVLSMHSYEEPRGRLRLRELDTKTYYRLRDKTDQLLDRISDDHALKLKLAKVACILLTINDIQTLLDDEYLIELFLRQYHKYIVDNSLHERASLDGNPRIITELIFEQKRNLAELIIHKIGHLIPTP